jgi:hypothetical protein
VHAYTDGDPNLRSERPDKPVPDRYAHTVRGRRWHTVYCHSDAYLPAGYARLPADQHAYRHRYRDAVRARTVRADAYFHPVHRSRWACLHDHTNAHADVHANRDRHLTHVHAYRHAHGDPGAHGVRAYGRGVYH